MSTRTGIAVFGVGRWGVHLVRNFLEHPQAQLVAVVDPCRDRLTTLSEKFDLGDRVLLTTDWSEALHLPELDAVVIVTPASTHNALITAALRRGLHVLSEKPLTLAPKESVELCRLAEQQQRQLVVDHTYLFHSAVIRGRAVLEAQQLGELRYGYAARTHLGPVRQDVDALWDLAIHDIAIFNHWLGQTPCRVQAVGNVWLQPTCQSNRDKPPEISFANQFPKGLSDLVWVTLTYPDGFQSVIHLCWFNPDKQRRLAIAGSQGTLIFDELRTDAPLIIQPGHLDQVGEQFIPNQQAPQVLDLQPAEPLQQLCDHFLDCVQRNTPSTLSSGWLGAELVQILAALTESLNQGGQAIAIQPLRP